MHATAALRLQIETTLAIRVPAALTLKIKQAPELFATGISEVDAVLGDGIPRGSITELSGTASTGKTSFGLSAIAAITRSGAACAWVDVTESGTSDPPNGLNVCRHDSEGNASAKLRPRLYVYFAILFVYDFTIR